MNAIELIEAIRDEVGHDLQAIKYALEDGAALAAIGVTDADQAEVEDAHAMIVDQISA